MELDRYVVPAFVTPIVNYRFDDVEALNAGLAEAILGMEATAAGLQKSNVGGWHSDMHFLQRDVPEIARLRERLEDFGAGLLRRFAVPSGREPQAFCLEGWANVLRRGQYNTMHCHPNASWSMVYYVTGNEPVEGHPFSGKLELIDPRPGASLSFSEDSSLYGRILLNPQPGQLIAFPAWLQHQVHPSFSDAARLSVAVNLLHQALRAP